MNVAIHIKTACGEETVVDFLESLYTVVSKSESTSELLFVIFLI